MIATDPFTRGERLLWFLLESWPGFTDRVQAGNRIKLHESATKLRGAPNPQAGDMPEVVIVPAGGQGEQQRTSAGHGFAQDYEIQVSTAWMETQGNAVDAEAQTGINPLRWEILKAIVSWQEVFPAYPEVWKIDAVPYVSNPPGTPNQQTQAPRGPGWEAVVTVTVHFDWSKTELDQWL